MKKLLIISLFILCACTTKTYQGAKAGLAEDTLPLRERLANNIYPEKTPRPTEQGNYVYNSDYCYKTWSGQVCYDEPLPNR